MFHIETSSYITMNLDFLRYQDQVLNWLYLYKLRILLKSNYLQVLGCIIEERGKEEEGIPWRKKHRD